MKLCPEFENVQSNLMSRQPSPSLETCLNDILQEEQRQLTQTHLTQHTPNGPIEVAYVVKGKPLTRKTPQSTNGSSEVAYVVEGKSPGRDHLGQDFSKIQCYSCKEYGHYSSQCRRKICNYCKATGHVIVECRKWPATPYHGVAPSSNTTSMAFTSSSFVHSQPSSSADVAQVTLEMIQQMIFRLQAYLVNLQLYLLTVL